MLPLVLSVCCLVVVSLLVIRRVARRIGWSWFGPVGSLAFLGHFLFAVVVLPRLPYAWDIAKFHGRAMSILAGRLPSPNPTVNSFAALEAVLYAVLTPDPTVVAVFNGLLAVLVVVPVVDLTRSLYPELPVSHGVAIPVLFLPLPFVFLTVPMRDALSVLLFFVVLAALARGVRGNLWPPVLVIPVWGALSLLRPELGIVVLAAGVAGAGLLLLDVVLIRPLRIRSLTALTSVLALAATPFVGPFLPVESINTRVQSRAIGGAAYLEHADYETWVDLVVAAPIRAVYFQYAPFPLHVSSAFDLVAVGMLPVLVALTVAAYRSARACYRSRSVLAVVVVVYVLGVIGYGLIDSNFGTTVRHRIPFTFLLCVLAGPTLERWWRLVLGRVGLASVSERARD
ncbi:hypothetical protein [Natronomonas sp. EA1]|uniref:hypothetical protein n=1 Tax=Natronomonas sp. EA1 TaxID=3421655 RepID=UPI003EB79020